MSQIKSDWIAVDWGTTRMRVWIMADDGTILHRSSSRAGMSRVAREDYEPALLQQIADFLPDGKVTDVLICGAAGSKQGWHEAPYVPVPAAPPCLDHAIEVPIQDPRVRVRIIPGMSQASPPDVMRGEETQIAGFLDQKPDFDGVLCLPGTQTKWARISAGEVVSFQSFMTGELFAAISEHSLLRYTVGPGGGSAAEFEKGVRAADAKPEALAARLFSIRSEALLNGLSGADARGRLSGLLIGMELAAARPYWLGMDVSIIGDIALSSRYKQALAFFHQDATVVDVEEMTLSGLKLCRDCERKG